MTKVNDLFWGSADYRGPLDPEKAKNGLGLFFCTIRGPSETYTNNGQGNGCLYQADVTFSNAFESDMGSYGHLIGFGNTRVLQWRQDLIDKGHDAVIMRNNLGDYYIPLYAYQIENVRQI